MVEKEVLKEESARDMLLMPEHINKQLGSFVDLLKGYNSTFSPERQHPEKAYKFLKGFFSRFIKDRNSRAEEVDSPAYKKVLELANSLLPMEAFAVLCMDGRVKLIHIFGFPAGVGNSVRVPGGLLKDFIRGKDGSLKLAKGSNFAGLLDEASSRRDSLTEIFDSHKVCKARKKEAEARGYQPEDDGLLDDVMDKRRMVEAAKKYIIENKTSGDDRQVVFVQTTFDPLTGFLYIGLETDKALQYAKDIAINKANKEKRDPESAMPVYTKDVIKSLIEKHLIISTGQLINNEIIREKLDEKFFDAKWKNEYVKTAEQFWRGISEIKDSLLPIFERSLISIYPELSHDDPRTKKELEEKAMLLLCNSYNAYLHNKTHVEIDYLSIEDEEYESAGHYEYDNHNEAGIAATVGGYPPYDISTFVIHNEDLHNMPVGIEEASGMVRDNRRDDRIIDFTRNYFDPEEFRKAPVPVAMQEIIRDGRLTEEDWKVLDKADWSDLPADWDTMTQQNFAAYLQRKGKFSISLANGIENLRNKMKTIFDPNTITAAHSVGQYKVILPVICDQSRRIRAIIPFLKLGY